MSLSKKKLRKQGQLEDTKQKREESTGKDKKDALAVPGKSKKLSYAACVIAKDPSLKNLPQNREEARTYLRKLRGLQ